MLCWIWDKLAKIAVNKYDNDFFVLFGDDIEIHGDWQQEVLDSYCQYAVHYPFGFGCVAIQDESFPVFPTFPVMNRTHLDIFWDLFPPQFKNQHGDPYLFELYRRFGNARFTPTSYLKNKTGGNNKARYKKINFTWRDTILSKSIEKANDWVSTFAKENIWSYLPFTDTMHRYYSSDLSL